MEIIAIYGSILLLVLLVGWILAAYCAAVREEAAEKAKAKLAETQRKEEEARRAVAAKLAAYTERKAYPLDVFSQKRSEPPRQKQSQTTQRTTTHTVRRDTDDVYVDPYPAYAIPVPVVVDTPSQSRYSDDSWTSCSSSSSSRDDSWSSSSSSSSDSSSSSCSYD